MVSNSWQITFFFLDLYSFISTWKNYIIFLYFLISVKDVSAASACQQPYHPAAQDWLPTEAKQRWAGQYLDGRPPGKTRLLLVEVLVRPAGGAHPAVCVGPNAPV